MDLNVSKYEQRETAVFLGNTELYVKFITNRVVSFVVGEWCFSMKGRELFGELPTVQLLLYC